MKVRAEDIRAVKDPQTGRWHWTVPSVLYPDTRTRSLRGRASQSAALRAGRREYGVGRGR